MESPAKSKRLVGSIFFERDGRIFRVFSQEPRFSKSAIVYSIDRLEDEYKGFLYARKRPTLPDTVHPQVHREKEQHTGRKPDVADLLFDTLGAPSELGPHDISLILHFLKYLLTCLLFCNFSIFPGTIRPRCTTMPWTIWPALVVLWGVCWMFHPPRSDAQFKHSGTSHSEIENSQPGEFGISIHSRCQISGSRKASGSITEGISTAVQETVEAITLSLCGDRLFAVTLPFL
jgi:hypothetical protein